MNVDLIRPLVRLGGCAAGLLTFGHALAGEVPTDPSASSFSGLLSSIAIAGDRIYVGRPDVGQDSAGCVCVYQRVAGIWCEMERIEPEHPESNMCFGRAIAATADELYIAAPGTRHASDCFPPARGSIFIYRCEAQHWTLVNEIADRPDLRTSGLADELTVDGEFLIAQYSGFGDMIEIPFVILQRRNGHWEVCAIPKETGNERRRAIRWPVRVDHGTLVAPSAFEGHRSTKSVSVYERFGDEWKLAASLLAQNGPNEISFFGDSIAIDRDTILAGGAVATVAGVRTGAVYVYQRRDGEWKQADRIVPPPGERENIRLGGFVTLHGDVAVIAAEAGSDQATTSAELHVHERTGDRWVRTAVLRPSESEHSVWVAGGFAFHDGLLAVNEITTSPDGSTSRVLVFEKRDGAWGQVSMLTSISADSPD